jgi:hypothetical protein
MTKALKNKWKSFKKTLIFFEKKASMEHQNQLYGLLSKGEAQTWGPKVLEVNFIVMCTKMDCCSTQINLILDNVIHVCGTCVNTKGRGGTSFVRWCT